MQNKKYSSYNAVLILLCVANILDLFVPRIDAGNYFVRLPIQIINGGLLLIMLQTLLFSKLQRPPMVKMLIVFITLIFVYSIIYAVGGDFDLSKYSPYLKMLVWLVSIVFFFNRMTRFGVNLILFRSYIITFIISVAKHLLESNRLDSEKVGGGDTLSLPLLFIIPLILIFFDKNFKILMLGLVCMMIFFSLRRTAILGLGFCLPFFYKDLKSSLKPRHIFFILIVFVGVLAFTWEHIGNILVTRFQELAVGDGGGEKDSFGSGRSTFYLIVWNGWWNGGWQSVFFGNGLTSVNTMLMRAYGLGHAHNDFLEIGYTFGLLGISIWCTVIYRFWRLRKRIRAKTAKFINIFYIAFISYMIVGMASGCVLKVTTLPFGLTVSILLFLAYGTKPVSYVAPEAEPETAASI